MEGEKYDACIDLQEVGRTEQDLKIEGSELGATNDNDSLCEEGVTSEKVRMDDDDMKYLQDNLTSVFEPIGLDVHPFLVGWYNEKVGEKFQLDYSKDTLAFVVIGGPELFEKCIIPYVRARILEDPDFHSNDLLEDSMRHAFTIVTSDLNLEGFETEVVYDSDLHPSRRPKILVQTAAHVAGAVQYLHKNNLPLNIQLDRFEKKSNLNGVAIHPKYGGWYAIRGVIIFRNVRQSAEIKSFQKPDPVELFTEPTQIARVLELFAYHWMTNEWRDFHRGLGLKYSNDFITYLGMESAKRWDFVKRCSLTEDDPGDGDSLVPSTKLNS